MQIRGRIAGRFGQQHGVEPLDDRTHGQPRAEQDAAVRGAGLVVLPVLMDLGAEVGVTLARIRDEVATKFFNR